MTIDNELLAKFEGRCWHEAIETTSVYSTCKSCGITLTRWYEIGWRTEREQENNPSYSASPDDRERLWLYLMGKEEMWASFRRWVVDAYCRRLDGDTVPFIPWLFSPLDGAPVGSRC